ncbi:MAG: hypothetical protein IKM73_00120 [Acidaminococcaceae bacterium]|nr:hypothetical protein [Acidaminococcaceae bacterium]
MTIKKLNDVTIERYSYGDYIVEVEELNDEKNGLMWDFWLYRNGMGVKEFMIGLPANQMQSNNPHVYTKEEALELGFFQLDDHIKFYQENYECD